MGWVLFCFAPIPSAFHCIVTVCISPIKLWPCWRCRPSFPSQHPWVPRKRPGPESGIYWVLNKFWMNEWKNKWINGWGILFIIWDSIGNPLHVPVSKSLHINYYHFYSYGLILWESFPTEGSSRCKKSINIYMVYPLTHQALALGGSVPYILLGSWRKAVKGSGWLSHSNFLPPNPSCEVRLREKKWQGFCKDQELPQRSCLVPF